MAGLAFVLMVGWCTTETECWTREAEPARRYQSLAECRDALPGRAREALMAHFRAHDLDLSIACAPVAPRQTASAAGSAPPEEGGAEEQHRDEQGE